MRIGTLAAAAGLTTKTIRFYEQAGLLAAPPRTVTGYRDYPAEAADRLAFIRDAQAAGLTLAEIRGVLAIRDAGQPPCQHVTTLIEVHLEHVEQRIADLLATRTALQDLHQRAQDVHPADCGPEGICRILTSRSKRPRVSPLRPPCRGVRWPAAARPGRRAKAWTGSGARWRGRCCLRGSGPAPSRARRR